MKLDINGEQEILFREVHQVLVKLATKLQAIAQTLNGLTSGCNDRQDKISTVRAATEILYGEVTILHHVIDAILDNRFTLARWYLKLI